jgi:hypothetical protein
MRANLIGLRQRPELEELGKENQKRNGRIHPEKVEKSKREIKTREIPPRKTIAATPRDGCFNPNTIPFRKVCLVWADHTVPVHCRSGSFSWQNGSMHPAGIKFGLTHNLLQLSGANVVLSDQLLEHVSAAARRQLHGKRIDAGDLMEDVINRGLSKMNLAVTGTPRGEYTSFFVKVDIALFDTMYPYAERAGIGYRNGRTFFFSREFATELYARKNILRRAGDAYGYKKVLFLACYDSVVARCKRVLPGEARHADLLALCMFQAYSAISLNMLFERFGS